MASNKTMLYGLLISFSVHAGAFIYWKTDFKFAKPTDFTQNIKNEIGIKLVKYTQPIKQTVKTVPKQKKTSLSSQNIQNNTSTINKTKTKFPIKEISKKLPPSTKVASKNNKKKDTTDNNSKQTEEKNKEEINKQNNILSDKKAQQLKKN